MEGDLGDFPVFADVPGFEYHYHAHRCGFIVSNKRTLKNCLRPSLNKNGYLKITLSRFGESHYNTVGRLVAMAFIPNPLGLPEVNHKDGNKANNCVLNLEWTTGAQNKTHAWETGLYPTPKPPTGIKSYLSKLTQEQVDAIRAVPSIRDLAKMYGVHHSIITGIRKGRRYPVQVLPIISKPS